MSQERKTIFKYNGIEYEFDVSDAEDAEKIENAYKLMEQESNEIPKDGKASTQIKEQCKLIRNFLDRSLTQGAGVNLCGEKYNLENHYSAYETFLRFVSRQKSQLISHSNNFRNHSNRNRNNKKFKAKK